MINVRLSHLRTHARAHASRDAEDAKRRGETSAGEVPTGIFMKRASAPSASRLVSELILGSEDCLKLHDNLRAAAVISLINAFVRESTGKNAGGSVAQSRKSHPEVRPDNSFGPEKGITLSLLEIQNNHTPLILR